MKKIGYSIVTPVFNRADCVERCIQSVINNLNNISQLEHILVDDGSSDHTVDIIKKYAAKYTHINFVKFLHNQGTNAARNAAISIAKSDWCIFLDSDDYFKNDALAIINETMEVNSGYKHYMFTPDDMQAYYKQNPLLNGRVQLELQYTDFLKGDVGGDFIHVCNTEILRAHPFDNRVRIYEGVFFLMFFRDAQKMLFTNKVVTVRERNRADSVSRDFIRTNIQVIERTILSCDLMLSNFEDDFKKYGVLSRLYSLRIAYLDNCELLERYAEAQKLIDSMGKAQCMKERILRIIHVMHAGSFYRKVLQFYLVFKYQILKKKLRV